MRTAFVAVLVFAAPALSAEKLLPRTMEVGKTGELFPAGTSAPLSPGVVRYIITEVGDDWLALRVDTQETTSDGMTILVRGIPTKGLVDGREWRPAGLWKVEKTEKYKGKTVFSLKPHDPEKK